MIDIQIASSDTHIPSIDMLTAWARAAVNLFPENCAMSIRVTDEKEMIQLNRDYRHIDKATNVLSFPAELPDVIKDVLAEPLLGDIVICATIIEREAFEQNKNLEAHWAHIVIHGTLHLLGYDHIKDEEAEKMETLEIELLSLFGYADPYNDRIKA